MTSTFDPNRSTSSSTWLVTITHRPSAPRRWKSPTMWLRWRGSRPANGSSRTITGGSCTIACASLTRCRIPFEYVGSLRVSSGSSSTLRSASAAASAGSGTPFSTAVAWTNACAVSGSKTDSCCGASPMSAVTSTSVRGLRPSTRTVPFDGCASPQSIRSIVDLPAPFGPRSAVTPTGIVKLTSETATTPPNHFETPSTSTTGAVMSGPRSAGTTATSRRRRPQSRRQRPRRRAPSRRARSPRPPTDPPRTRGGRAPSAG